MPHRKHVSVVHQQSGSLIGSVLGSPRMELFWCRFGMPLRAAAWGGVARIRADANIRDGYVVRGAMVPFFS